MKSESTVGNATSDGPTPAKSKFPNVSDKIVAYWLLGSAASVFGIVVFGGLTRLTESGWVVFNSIVGGRRPNFR